MSQENVDTFKRASDAINRRDAEALLSELDPEIESPHAAVVEFKNGKGILIRTYLDPNEALEAVGLRGLPYRAPR
jgi:hypothetical protein